MRLNVDDVGFLAIGAVAVGLLALVTSQIGSSVKVEQKVIELRMYQASPSADLAVSTGSKVTLPYRRAGTCSGLFVNSSGFVLTAKHCIEGFDSWEVETSDHQVYDAAVVRMSPTHDLALLRINRLDTPYFELATSLKRGQKVFVLGSPLSITNVLSTGIVAAIKGDSTLLDCAALPGNSGGPVFNEDGELVGVLTAGFVVMMGTTHLNIAQSLDVVTNFLLGPL